MSYYFKSNKIIIKIILFISLINILKNGIFLQILKEIYYNFIKYEVKKICLCSPAKNENKYIIEFVEYYLKYGVDKIFIYDNNDIYDEKFEEIISNYIKNGLVEIINFRGKERAQIEMMNDCYTKNHNKFDWLFFFDIDEFLFLKKYNNFKTYLNNLCFNNCKKIHFNWVFFTDNNLLYYDNRSLFKRFFEKEPKVRYNKSRKAGIKTIIKGHLKNIKVECQHRISLKFQSCDGFGNIKKLNGIETEDADYENYYIKHFYCKSTEEFINKITKGDLIFGHDENWKLAKIKTYFGYNKITLKKINYIENETGFNLSEYKNQLYNPKIRESSSSFKFNFI